MSMVYRWLPAGSSVSTDLGNQVIRLGDIPGFKQSGIVGQADVITLTFDNPGDALNLTGMRPFYVVENTAPANNQVIWYGYIQARSYKRDASRSMITGADNTITADIVDLNAALAWAMITASSGKRPAETATARVNWLLGLSNCPVADYGKVTAPTLNMDANDYRGQFMSDVLGDVASQSGYNFFAYFDESHNAGGLWLNDPNAGTDTSTLRISNVLSEVDNVTTFYPYPDAELRRSPERVASGVWLPYKTGAVYKTNATTRSNFANVDRSAPMANVATKTKATAAANRFLADNDEEDDVITVTIRVPAASVNLARVGQTIAVHFSHLPGYSATFTNMSIMDRNVAQPVEDDTHYVITYTLSGGIGPQAASFVQAKLITGYPAGDPNITLDRIPGTGHLLVLLTTLRANAVPGAPTDVSWTTIDSGIMTISATSDKIGWRLMYRTVLAGEDATYDIGGSYTTAIAEFAGGPLSLDGSTAATGNGSPTSVTHTPTAGINALLVAVAVTGDHNTPSDYGMANTGVDWSQAGAANYNSGAGLMGDASNSIAKGPQIGMFWKAVPNTAGAETSTASYTNGYGGPSASYWTAVAVSFAVV